jgi:hypothetical protein
MLIIAPEPAHHDLPAMLAADGIRAQLRDVPAGHAVRVVGSDIPTEEDCCCAYRSVVEVESPPEGFDPADWDAIEVVEVSR